VLKPYQPQDPKNTPSVCYDGFHVIETPLSNWIQRLKGDYKACQDIANKQRTTNSIKPWIYRQLHRIRQHYGIFASCHMPDLTDFWVPKALSAVQSCEPWDVMISTAPPFPVHRLGYEIKRQGITKHWIADYRDLVTQSPITPGLFPFSWIEKRLEKRFMKAVDAVTTVSDGLADSLKTLYSNVPISIVENGHEPEYISMLPPEPFFSDHTKFRIVYLGVIYPGKRDPSPLFQAIRELADSPRHRGLLNRLEVLFYGPEMGDLERLVDKYNVSAWVCYSGFVDHLTSLRIQRDASALLFLSWTTPNVEGMLSGKIFEYVASGTPVIAIGGKKATAPEELIESTHSGDVFGCDADKIKNYLVSVLQQKDFPRKSVNNSTVLERYSRKVQAEKLLKLMALIHEKNQ
jgi:glycosyltransferase involved in cell wall biosynthesis